MATARETLPNSVKPSHYTIELQDLELGGAWSYQGLVKINLEILNGTNQVVINVHQLKISGVELFPDFSNATQSSTPTSIQYDDTAQRAIFNFSDTLTKTRSALLLINFSGTMNNAMAGFYRSRYKPAAPAAASVPRDDEFHYMFSTQFESCDARRAFPCFDEPNLKATFDVSIEIPRDQTALSNMPEKETKEGTRSDLKIVSFERTPVMSTYLLAWAFGDFEYVEDFTRRKYNGKTLPVRVYTTRGLKEQGRFALSNAHQVVDLFSEVFQIDYPLPKADLLAVHEFSHGAMENWGLVTYRTTAVLFDEANSDQRYMNRVAYVVSHELAHQWFGNLVTMDWWDELWLNEGFATWVGWYAVNHLYPEWNVWGQFVNEDVQSAFALDSLRNSHPIEVPVRNALEVDQIFDAISYRKGSSVLRMLAAYLGVDVFLKGVSSYLKAHEYANATTRDLWSSLNHASGKDVNSFMENWIRKIGFPVLTVAEEPGQLGVRQSRFLTTGDLRSEEDETVWWIPLGLKSSAQSLAHGSLALSIKQDTVRDVDEQFYKLNADQNGFYRTNYPPARLIKLGESREQLSIPDRIGLIGDAAALAASGHGTTAALLSLVENFRNEQNYLVWSQIVSALGNVRSIFANNDKVSTGLRQFTLKLVTPATDRLGWESAASDDYLTRQLRSLLIATAGLAGHEGVIAEAKWRFDLYTSGADRKAIHPNLRSAVWRIAITEGSKSEYEAIKHEFLTTSSVDGKEIALQSMGRVQTAELAQDFFAFFTSDRVAIQDIHSGAMSLAANAKTRDQQWELIKKDWPSLHKKMSDNSVVLDRFLRVSLNKFASREIEQDIVEFFDGKDNRGYDRGLNVISDTISGNANYVERDEELILEWLQAHGYY